MRPPHTRAMLVALLLLALAGAARADEGALALRGAPTGGGGALSAGGYTLAGAIGQPVAGSARAGDYSLSAGVVPPGSAAQPAPPAEQVFLPLLAR